MIILEFREFKEASQALSGIALFVDNKICLVLPKKFKDDDKYSIPKGHIEGDKTSYYSAYKELKEESGINLGLHSASESFKYTYKKNGVKKDLMVYVVKLTSEQYNELKISKRDKSEIANVEFVTKEKALGMVEKQFKQLIRYLYK